MFGMSKTVIIPLNYLRLTKICLFFIPVINSRIINLIVAFIVILLAFSCDKKFEKTGWNYSTDSGFPPPARERMLDDLLSSHKLTGMKYSTIIELLGTPDYQDSTHLMYEIEVDYGYDIDPVYTKNLLMMMDNDSIVNLIEVREWRSGEEL